MRKKTTIECWTNVFSDHHVAIVDLVSLKDGPNHFLVDLRELDCGIDLFTFSKARPAEGVPTYCDLQSWSETCNHMVSTTHSPRGFLLENDCSNKDSVWMTCNRVPTVWLRFVETYSNCIKLRLQKPSLLHGLGGIQYDENKVGSLGHFIALRNNQILQIRRLLPATTCRPLPRPCAAPSTIPGRSSNWIRTPVLSSLNKAYSWVDSTLPLYSRTPGIAVKVVNSYAAASLAVFVTFDKTRRINDQ